jgi:lipid-binding SYLF domain-containing protein
MYRYFVALSLLITLGSAPAYADKYSDAANVFRNSGASAQFFHSCYGYAIFPTVGEGGFIVGVAIGKGRVYVHHRLVGDTTMTQGSVGFQAGGKAYSQIIFFEDKRALEEFQSGTFEFGAGASVTAVTASAGGAATTAGATANASAGIHDGTTATLGYNKGMAVFTMAKGGLMYAATIAGQKFSYKPRGAE